TGRRPQRRRSTALLTALALIVATLTATASAPSAAAASTTTVEQQFSNLLNSSRRSYGRRALSRSAELNSVARSWARYMASRNRLAHNPRLTRQVRNWRFVGENVGVGPSTSSLHSALMRSPGHRANILDRDFTQSGIGVAYGHGRIWVVQVFRKPASSASRSSQRTKTLAYGSRGKSVKRLQRRLHVRPTGYFGPKTRKALKKYQKRNRLRVTGKLDSSTRRAMRW
ncbi:MAG: CAP domain-containing protein, partial [Angustibacter sp.]